MSHQQRHNVAPTECAATTDAVVMLGEVATGMRKLQIVEIIRAAERPRDDVIPRLGLLCASVNRTDAASIAAVSVAASLNNRLSACPTVHRLGSYPLTSTPQAAHTATTRKGHMSLAIRCAGGSWR